MKHFIKPLRIQPLIALILMVCASGMAQAQTRDLSTGGVLLDRVAAVVNDGVVLKSEVDQQVAQMSERMREQKGQLPPVNVLRQRVLEHLVMQEIQLQRAKQTGVEISDEMLNNAIKNIAESNKMTLDQMPNALEAQGINYAAYRDSLRKELAVDLLRRRDVLGRIIVTPRELDQYLARQSTSIEKQEFDVSHILLSVPTAATPEELEQAEKRAKDVYERAKKGEDFAQLAITYSNSQTALEGGALGWRKGPQLPSFIAELVGKMQPGEVSAPVRTPSGFHLVRLNDKRSDDNQVMVNQVHARHILIKTKALQDDDAVKQKLADLRKRIVDGEDFAKLAQTNSDDPGSAPTGGDLTWQNEDSFVPEFNKVLAQLNEKEISEPFKTRYGWHVVQLLGRRVQDVTDEARRQEAYAALRESKADEETELWIRRLRDEAFVEIKM